MQNARKRGFVSIKAPLAALIREEVLKKSHKDHREVEGPALRGSSSTIIHSSNFHDVDGLPLRLHGKMKYAKQIQHL